MDIQEKKEIIIGIVLGKIKYSKHQLLKYMVLNYEETNGQTKLVYLK